MELSGSQLPLLSRPVLSFSNFLHPMSSFPRPPLFSRCLNIVKQAFAQ